MTPENPLTPKPTIELEGKHYSLSYKRGDIVNAELKLKRTFIGDLNDALGSTIFGDVLLFTGLQRAIPGLTFEQAQDMITTENQQYVFQTVKEAFETFNPKAKDKEEEGPVTDAPPLAETNGGTLPGPSAYTTSV